MRSASEGNHSRSACGITPAAFDLSMKPEYSAARFGTLLLASARPETIPNDWALIDKEEMLDTHFNRILISSLVNGFAGLDKISPHLILKHLLRYRFTSSNLMEYMRSSKTHAAKALSESLFRAAIEAGDVTASQLLIDMPGIDVNITLSPKDPKGWKGSPLTAIHYAVCLGNFELVRLLRIAGARAVPTISSRISPTLLPLLDYLFVGVVTPGTSRIEYPDVKDYTVFIPVTRELLLAGLEINAVDVDSAVRRLVRSGTRITTDTSLQDFIFFLANQCIKKSHAKFFRVVAENVFVPVEVEPHTKDSLLLRLVNLLRNDQSEMMIRDIIGVCEREHDGDCINARVEEASSILAHAARKGHLYSVHLLLPYSKHLHRAFVGAVISQNSAVIDAVLEYSSDICIDPPGELLFGSHEPRTPFSEAVKYGNDRIIKMMIDHGHMDRIDHGSRFQPALAAAVEVNGLEMLRYLLDRYYHPHPLELGPALIGALLGGNELAAKILMDSGAVTRCSPPTHILDDVTERLFVGAVRSRTKDLMCMVLDSVLEYLPISDRPEHVQSYCNLLLQMVRWGNQSVLEAFLTTFPSAIFEFDELKDTLERNDLVTFQFLLDSCRVCPSAFDWALEFAVRQGNEKMVGELINLGANPMDSTLLQAASETSLHMMTLIFSQEWTPKALEQPGNGNKALCAAIRMGTQGLNLVQCLLQHSTTIGLPIVSPETAPNHGLRLHLSPMGLAQQSCQQTNEGLKLVELFLDAGHSPDIIVKSEDIIWFDEYIAPQPSVLQAIYHHGGKYSLNTTALLHAIELANTDMVTLLLDRGADINLPTRCRILRTPLQKACECGNIEIVKLLLDRGADPNGKPAQCQGFTALQLDAISGNCSIAAMLLEHGADLHQAPLKAGGRWPLEGAAENGRLEMIEFLWRVSVIGFDKPICDFALKVAEKWGHLACRDLIKDLIENGPVSETEGNEELLEIL